jgi:hypothetical protein
MGGWRLRSDLRIGWSLEGRVPWSGGNEGLVVNLSDVMELVA